MAQHDYVIANGTGAAVRSDLNNALAAIVSQNSGATAPSTTYAYMPWADTTTGLYKIRNAANNGWITLYQLDGEWSTLAVENGSAAAPSIYFKDSGTDTGIYSPGTDQVAISTGGTVRLSLSTSAISSALPIDYPLGAVGTPSITFTGDLNTGLWSPAADTIAASTGGTERLRIDSSGRVGIGTTTPRALLDIGGSTAFNAGTYQSPKLAVSNGYISIKSDASDGVSRLTLIGDSATGDGTIDWGGNGNTSLKFTNNGSERGRWDSSGRFLVGTSSSASTAYGLSPSIQVAGTGSASALSVARYSADAFDGEISFQKSRSASIGSQTVVNSGDALGVITWTGSDGTAFRNAASIEAFVDATPGANDMPGRLVFSTTADGSASPTRRFQIAQNGQINFANLTVILPETDNAVQLGGPSYRFSAVWAANGTIQTSDERAKTDITEAQLGSDFIKSLRPVSYKWIEGGKVDTGKRDENGNYIYEAVPGTRTHWGFIAQEVKQVVDAAGVDFGGWVLTDKDDPDSQQALRYDQFIAPLTKALQEALQKIEDLEQRLTDAGIA